MAKERSHKPKESRHAIQRSSIVHKSLLAEAVWIPSKTPSIQYAIFRDNRLSIRQSLTLDGCKYIPPSDPNGLLEKNVVLLASEAASYGSHADLFNSLQDFIHRYCDIPEFWEKLIATYAFMTWVYDRFTALPYLRFLGEASTGKSRCLQVVGHLCYKGITAGGAITSSPIFRLMDIYGGTFIVDEADFKDSDQWVEIIKILNCGYMRGLPVLRSAKAGEDYEPRAFDAFGPKIIANRSRFDDRALETRCITLETEERPLRKDIPRQLPPRFFDEARELRNKLLRWRFDNYHRISTDESALLDLDPRLTQIGTPLYAVSEDEEFRKQLIDFMGKSALEGRSESLQAIIVESLRRLTERGLKVLTVKTVSEESYHICQKYDDSIRITPRKAGALLRSLGFKPERKNDGYTFSVNPEKLKELCERYGVNL